MRCAHGAGVAHEEVEWTPRSGNQEADELANGKAERFSPALRVEVILGELVWQILPRLGREAEEMFDEAKKNGAPLKERSSLTGGAVRERSVRIKSRMTKHPGHSVGEDSASGQQPGG